MRKIGLKISIITLLAALVVDAILAWVFMYLWNACLPKMFDGVKVIEYWTAFLFLIFCGVIKMALNTSVRSDKS